MDQLRRDFDFLRQTIKMRELFHDKNIAYGDSYFTNDDDLLMRWQNIKRKVARIESFVKNGTQGVPDETIEDTFLDLANYCIMEIMKRKMEMEK